MNREIKFRIRDVGNKEMLEVQELDFEPTGRDMTIHIKQDDGRIWYCPENNIIEVKE